MKYYKEKIIIELLTSIKIYLLIKTQVKSNLEGTKFSEIYALYNFDRSLRNLFLEKILKIENSIKFNSL